MRIALTTTLRGTGGVNVFAPQTRSPKHLVFMVACGLWSPGQQLAFKQSWLVFDSACPPHTKWRNKASFRRVQRLDARKMYVKLLPSSGSYLAESSQKSFVR